MPIKFRSLFRLSVFSVAVLSAAPSLAGIAGVSLPIDEAKKIIPQSEPPCEADVSPYDHAVDDGHEHYHHKEAVGSHYHGDVWHGPDHTHGGHHDGDHGKSGCDQTGMHRDMFEDQPALTEIDIVDAVIGTKPSVIVRGEAYAWEGHAPVKVLKWGSDEALANSGLPGKGTIGDPYVIENRFVTEKLEVSNTDACVVVRNNIATGTHIKGPLVSPLEIVDISMIYNQLKRTAEEAEEEAKTARFKRKVALDAYRETLPDYYQSRDERRAASVDVAKAREAVRATQREIGQQNTIIRASMKSASEAHASIKKMNKDAPPMTDDLFAFAKKASSEDSPYADEIRQIQEAAEAISGAKEQRQKLEAQLVEDRSLLAEAQKAFEDVNEQYAAAVQVRGEALSQFRVANNEYHKAYREFRNANAQANDAKRKLKSGSLEYAGKVFDTKKDIVDWVLSKIKMKEENAKIVLDWNGTCMHAYHNISDDLRVNQNNARTGYATGGLIENNRFHDVGQLRHYDGVFRENEVGNRKILSNFLEGKTWIGDRAINVDGFNQGMLTDNTFYGRVDLDFHGHHHGAGFFSSHSHYHGDDQSKKKMRHDHTQRWTSVLFSKNVVIDPAGAGIRYEDRNHNGDDRQANSENNIQLNAPHIHRSLIEIHDNFVIGSVFVDVFGADGVDVWSDDLSLVKLDPAGRILDAAKHLGADIISTHPSRNNGWLSIAGNRIIDPSGGLSAITIQAVKEAQVDINENEAASIGIGAKPTTDLLTEVDLANLNWGGSNSHQDSMIMMRGVKDSLTTVCRNRAYGFDRGLTATKNIQEDAPIDVCADNQIGDVNIVYTSRSDEFSLGNFIKTQLPDLFGDSNAKVIGGDVEPLPDVEYEQGH